MNKHMKAISDIRDIALANNMTVRFDPGKVLVTPVDYPIGERQPEPDRPLDLVCILEVAAIGMFVGWLIRYFGVI